MCIIISYFPHNLKNTVLTCFQTRHHKGILQCIMLNIFFTSPGTQQLVFEFLNSLHWSGTGDEAQVFAPGCNIQGIQHYYQCKFWIDDSNKWRSFHKSNINVFN